MNLNLRQIIHIDPPPPRQKRREKKGTEKIVNYNNPNLEDSWGLKRYFVHDTLNLICL